MWRSPGTDALLGFRVLLPYSRASVKGLVRHPIGRNGARMYPAVGREFASHSSVDHAAGEYVRMGFHHSNTVENYFSILKRGVIGTYHHVSEAHLARYLVEFDFRYSNRADMGITDAMRSAEAVRGVVGKRLTYHQPRKAA